MKHLLIHACAGWGKTQHIIERCSQDVSEVRRLIITLTLSGQDELEGRLRQVPDLSVTNQQVSGWYKFLMDHVVRPYLPLVFPGQRVTGFIFDPGSEKEKIRKKKKDDRRRYFSDTGMLYKDNLEELAAKVMLKSGGLVEDRLGRIYDEIVFDEVQDISRSGLDVIECLLKQRAVRCLLVGDSRQSVLDSGLASRKNKAADRQKLIEWYRQFQNDGHLTIEEKCETSRFNQKIAKFSDSIFPKELGFCHTVSRMKKRDSGESHEGVFLVAKEDIDAYYEKFAPKVLRHSSASWAGQDILEPMNFGVSKGRTYSRVMILASGPIQDFCLNNKALKGKSACGFYVAVTRARYSVAIVVNKPRSELEILVPPGFSLWPPDECYTLFGLGAVT
ncbi:AAA family ATPase [Corynebacterium bovis]|uniref:AAA family ATPase n=1 Tax=Corynebacterium bovis TaxID=36808 RepID=UPI002447A597|nr:AAA family ATPase [Corynebacterium bovis]MDH2455530.1 AAA family ATPase [Corynebacterium bovis]